MKDLSIASLRRKRKQLLQQLQGIEPNMLRGSLILKYRKCGKPNCHCTKEQGHGSYYLSVSRTGVNPILVYVPLVQKDMVERAVSNYRDIQKIIEEISNINRELLGRKSPF